MPTLHTAFTPVTIHTAKCDICNQHNRSVLFRCADCGWHVCSPCWAEKGGDGTHVVNEGDRGWTRERAVRVGVSEGEERIVARRRGKKMRGRDSRADEMVMEEGGEGSEMGSGERGVRRSMRQRGRGESKDLDHADVLAAADVLIQAASGATPSLSPPPRHARRPSASGHENANITSLLQAAAQIDHTRPASESDGASGRGRPTSPLFVPQGSPPHDFPALDMTPEPATPEDTAGEMPDDGEAQALGSLDQLELVELELQSPIPTASQRGVAAQEEVRNGGIPRSNRRKLEQQCDGVEKVPVAKRLRELYQRAVLVKDRKGRMRRPGGGAVVRRSEM